MNFLKKIFILVIFLFPLGEIIRINLGNNIVLKPIDIGVGCLVLFWVIYKVIKKKIMKEKLTAPILFFIIMAIISLFINYQHLSIDQFLSSLLYLIRWIVYTGIFFVVSDFDKEFKKKIVSLLIIVGSLIVVVGYVQYFFYSSLKNLFYLGWDEHMHRMFSVFLDPNFGGAFFVLYFLFITKLFLEKKNILMGALLITTLGAIFLTFSRSALISLIVSSILLFVLINKKMWIVFVLLTIIIVALISSRYFNIENINLFRVVSTEARIETSRNALVIIQDNPIFGIGFNSYRYVQIDYGFRNENAKLSHADAGVDNSILFIMATTGILGFISYIFMWFKILKTASILCIVSIVGIFIDSLFINSLFYTFIMFWLWTIIGLKENS